MADKDNSNDEYQFSELDSSSNESMGQTEPGGSRSVSSREKNVRLNALIVVGLVVIIFIMYRFIWPLFTGTKEPVKPAIPPVVQAEPKFVQPKIIPAPIQQAQPLIKAPDTELIKNVSAIEISQQGIRSDVSSLNGRVVGLNSKIDDLTQQMNKLNQALSSLSNLVAQQSQEMTILMARSQPKRVKHITKPHVPQVTYHIQAVIPGRAWLIGSNGSILTVREGIKMNGYGTVQLIDPMQGRIVTSSGKIIRFSPEDS